jgi:hypothetical protein
MAQRTISAAGGNWNSTATWAEGAVPTTSDHIVGLDTSGNLTMNVAGTVQYADFSNYLGTLTTTNNLTLNLSSATSSFSPTMSISGAIFGPSINITGNSFTIISNGCFFPRIQVNNTNINFSDGIRTSSLSNTTFNGISLLGEVIIVDGFVDQRQPSGITGTAKIIATGSFFGLTGPSNVGTHTYKNLDIQSDYFTFNNKDFSIRQSNTTSFSAFGTSSFSISSIGLTGTGNSRRIQFDPQGPSTGTMSEIFVRVQNENIFKGATLSTTLSRNNSVFLLSDLHFGTCDFANGAPTSEQPAIIKTNGFSIYGYQRTADSFQENIISGTGSYIITTEENGTHVVGTRGLPSRTKIIAATGGQISLVSNDRAFSFLLNRAPDVHFEYVSGSFSVKPTITIIPISNLTTGTATFSLAFASVDVKRLNLKTSNRLLSVVLEQPLTTDDLFLYPQSSVGSSTMSISGSTFSTKNLGILPNMTLSATPELSAYPLVLFPEVILESGLTNHITESFTIGSLFGFGGSTLKSSTASSPSYINFTGTMSAIAGCSITDIENIGTPIYLGSQSDVSLTRTLGFTYAVAGGGGTGSVVGGGSFTYVN